MAVSSKYFVTSSPGANFLDLDLGYGSLSLVGQTLAFTGSASVDAVFARPGVEFDFTGSGAGADKLYLTGNFADYTVTLDRTNITLTRGSGATAEKVTFTRATNESATDKIVFADGTVSSLAIYNYAQGTTTEMPTPAGETSLAPLAPAAEGSALNASLKAIALSSTGETFTLTKPGISFSIVGGAGVDKVYVSEGSSIDALSLGSSSDQIYMRGNWADYTKTVGSGRITFERVVNGVTERVVVAAGAGAANDQLAFADGSVLSSNARTALTTNATVALGAIAGYDATLVTPIAKNDMLASGFVEFQSLLLSFESGIDPTQLSAYKAKYSDATAVTYLDVEVINGITYPKVDAAGALVRKSMSQAEYFQTLRVGELFDPATATAADLKDMQYRSMNPWGFVGYQIGEALAMEAGYYIPQTDPETGLPAYYIYTADATWLPGETQKQVTLSWGPQIILTRTNTWQGTFTGKDGVNSLEDLRDPSKQELVIQAGWIANYRYIQSALSDANLEWSDVLAKSWDYTSPSGVNSKVAASMSGIIAAAHLGGAASVVDLLINDVVRVDETGTSLLTYMTKFGGNSVPWGTRGSDVLQGSEYANTFITGGGNDDVTTYGGADIIQIASDPGSNVRILDFDLASDVIELKGFEANGAPVFSKHVGGYAVITVGTGASSQTIELLSIKDDTEIQALESGESVYYSNDYKMSWNGEIENNLRLTSFDPQHDVLVAPSGAKFDNLLIDQVGSDVKLTFAADPTYVGAGYIIPNTTAETVSEWIGTSMQGILGDSGAATIAYTGTSNSDNLKGGAKSELFFMLGGGASDVVEGGGGRDTFRVVEGDVSWYGDKLIVIKDFTYSASDAANNDVLDLRYLSDSMKGTLAYVYDSAGAHIKIQRTDESGVEVGSTTLTLQGMTHSMLMEAIQAENVLFDSSSQGTQGVLG